MSVQHEPIMPATDLSDAAWIPSGMYMPSSDPWETSLAMHPADYAAESPLNRNGRLYPPHAYGTMSDQYVEHNDNENNNIIVNTIDVIKSHKPLYRDLMKSAGIYAPDIGDNESHTFIKPEVLNEIIHGGYMPCLSFSSENTIAEGLIVKKYFNEIPTVSILAYRPSNTYDMDLIIAYAHGDILRYEVLVSEKANHPIEETVRVDMDRIDSTINRYIISLAKFNNIKVAEYKLKIPCQLLNTTNK